MGEKQKLSRSRSRKFSRDVLLHLSRQYQQSTTPTNKTNPRRPIKRARVSKKKLNRTRTYFNLKIETESCDEIAVFCQTGIETNQFNVVVVVVVAVVLLL